MLKQKTAGPASGSHGEQTACPRHRDFAALARPPAQEQTGFTLLELMLTLTVLGVLMTLAAPSMQEMLARNRLKSAAHALAEDLQWTRGEAIRRNTELYVTFNPATWCYGVSVTKGCDCRLSDPAASSACTLPTDGEAILRTVAGVDFPGIAVSATFTGAPPETSFKPRRVTATGGSMTFTSGQGTQLRVVLSLLGRVRVCSPAKSVPGYPAC